MVDSLKGLLESSFLQAIDYIQQFFLKYIIYSIKSIYHTWSTHPIPSLWVSHRILFCLQVSQFFLQGLENRTCKGKKLWYRWQAPMGLKAWANDGVMLNQNPLPQVPLEAMIESCIMSPTAPTIRISEDCHLASRWETSSGNSALASVRMWANPSYISPVDHCLDNIDSAVGALSKAMGETGS